VALRALRSDDCHDLPGVFLVAVLGLGLGLNNDVAVAVAVDVAVAGSPFLGVPRNCMTLS
jgi:hypothetical protein